MPGFGQFLSYYERLFPFREPTFSFLKSFLPAGGLTILDIGCGTGSYIGRFGSEGYTAVGTDIDEVMIDHARRTYKKARFFNYSMSEIEKISIPFDLIYAIGNVVPHLPSGLLPAFFHSVWDSVKPGGFWIFQTVNWEQIIKAPLFSLPVIELDDQEIAFYRHYSDISEHSVRFSLKLQRKREVLFEDHYPLYPMNASDVIHRHGSLGFKRIGHYGDFLKADYNPGESPASIFVFRK